MASWGHVVFKAEPQVEYQRFCRMHHRHTGFCGQDAGYIKRYNYTGPDMDGRTATTDTWVCESHAQAFAARYKIPILEADPHVTRPGQIPHRPELNRPGLIGCICLACVTARARKAPAPAEDLSADMKRRGYK